MLLFFRQRKARVKPDALFRDPESVTRAIQLIEPGVAFSDVDYRAAVTDPMFFDNGEVAFVNTPQVMHDVNMGISVGEVVMLDNTGRLMDLEG